MATNLKKQTLFIDGDGCNAQARTLAIRLALRKCRVVVVANRIITADALVTVKNERLQKDVYISQNHVVYVVVTSEENATDFFILDHATVGDLVITRDLSFAKHLLEQDVAVISDYGEIYHKEMIDARIVRAETATAIRQADDTHTKSITALKKRKLHTKVMQKFSLALDRWQKGMVIS